MKALCVLCVVAAASIGHAQNYTVAAIRAAYNAGRYTDVVKMVDASLKYHAKDAQYPMLRGFAYDKLLEHALAVKDFTAVLELMPNMSAAYKWRGDSYKALGVVESALRDYSRAVALDPYLGRDIYAVSAELYLSIGDTARSADHLARFINTKPDKLLPQTASILLKTDSTYAAYVVTHVEWSDTTDWRPRLLHAYLLSRVGNDSAGSRESQAAMTLAVCDSAAGYAAADWLYSLHALRWTGWAYAIIAEKYPADPGPVARLGNVALQQGRLDSALTYYNRAFAACLGSNREDLAAEVCFRRGEIYERKEMPAYAAVEFSKAEQYAPGTSFARLLPPAPPRETTRTDTTTARAASPDTFNLPGRGDVFVLAVGVGRHKYADIPDCKYATADAQAFFDTMVNSAAGRVPPANARLLLDSAATGPEVRKYLVWLSNQSRSAGGTVLFYFSGHGAALPAAESGQPSRFLVPFDCDPAYLDATGLSLDDIEERMQAVTGARAFLAVDACFSGRGRSVAPPGQRALTVTPRVRSKPKAAPPSNLAVLTACGPDETATEYDPSGHGLFTHYLLAALSGAGDEAGNRDGWVDPGEVYRYVLDSVPRQAMAQNVIQHPQLDGRSDSIPVALNWQRLADAARDKQLAIVKAAYYAGLLTAEQFDRAAKEIASGGRSKLLLDFLDGLISAETFGRFY